MKGGESMDKEYITVLSGKVARHLLRQGYPIYDIKAMKGNTERTVFVFKNENNIYKAINSIT